jgi:hypothetical protein
MKGVDTIMTLKINYCTYHLSRNDLELFIAGPDLVA